MYRKINQAGLDIIKYYEGLRLDAYRDIGGVLTIGYGHTGEDVVEGQQITSMQAELLLKADVEKFERGIDRLVKPMLNDNRFSALVSFVYNVGLHAFEGSTLLKLINNSKFNEAADQFLNWNKVKGTPVSGLTARRRAERDLFIKPETFSGGSAA